MGVASLDLQQTDVGQGKIDYSNIKNKPKINGVTLEGNLSTEDINIFIPQRVSELQNDAGYITKNVSDLVYYYDKTEVDNMISTIPKFDIKVVDALPTEDISPTTIYLLMVEGEDHFEEYIYVDDEWDKLGDGNIDLSDYATYEYVDAELAEKVDAADLATVAFSGRYSDLIGTPTSLSQFTNDAGFITTAALPTKTSDLTNDGEDGTSTYVESNELATVATSGSYNDLTDKPTIDFELVEMSYGESNAWAKFIAAYQGNKIVYCRASSAANPASGSQTRKAFMAYVNNAENPTNVEFQYVRSVSTKTASQPVDQVFVYTLDSRNGGTWTVQTRDMAPKLAQGTNTTVSYSSGTYTISASQPTVNDATLTIQKNGTTVETFTANSSTNKTANIVVPTKTSDITNDSDFVNSTQVGTALAAYTYPSQDLYTRSDIDTMLAQISSLKIEVVNSLPQTGSADTIYLLRVRQQGNDIYQEYFWVNNAWELIGGIDLTDYYTKTEVNTLLTAKADVSAIPTKTSDLTNDSNFAVDANYVHTDNNYTTAEKNKLAGIAAGAEVNVQSDWNQTTTTADDYIKNKPSIPTKTSDLTNDSGFITTAAIPTNVSAFNNDAGYLDEIPDDSVGLNQLDSTIVNALNNINNKANTADLAAVAFSGDYDDLTDAPTIPTKTSDLVNDGSDNTSTYIETDDAQKFAIGQGSTNPVFDEMTPVKTIEWDVTDQTYRPIYQMANTGWTYINMDITVAYRITVTGTNIHSVTDIVDRWHNPASYPITSMFCRTLSASGATTGLRYLRAVYPVSAYLNNASYPLGTEIAMYNATARHVKIEVFKDNSQVTWNTTKPSGPIYVSSTYNNVNVMSAYDTRGWRFRQPAQMYASNAGYAEYISNYEPVNTAASELKNGATALAAGHYAFLADDGLVYDISNTAKNISMCESKVGLMNSSVAANAAISYTYWRAISRPNATQVEYISHDTFALGNRVFLRCTMDSSGNVHSDNYLSTTMSAGYTWMPFGWARSATTLYVDTRFPMFYTLDANGKLTHINGKEVAGSGAASVAWGDITGKPTFATVATSGSYNDLSNKPTIPAKQVFYGTSDSSGGSSSKAVSCSGFTYAEGNVIYVTFSNADTYSGDSSMIMNVNSTGAKVILTQTTSGGGIQSDHKWAAGETVCFVCHNGYYLMVEAAMATPTTSGLMSVNDKNKLDGIATGAEANVQANWTESNSSSDAYIQNKPSLATVATSGSYNDLTNKPTVPEIKKRTGASTTTNITPLYVAGDGTNTPMALQTHGDSHTGSFAYVNINEPTSDISEAYIGGYVWDEYEDWWRKMSEVRLALYSDIPAVPTVNNATLTIQKNGTNVATFTANASSNVTADISVPALYTTTGQNTDGAVTQKLFSDTVGNVETILQTLNNGGGAQ